MSEMTLDGLHNALNGGTKLEAILVFTDQSEAEEANRANSRLQQTLNTFTRDEILSATSIALLAVRGGIIQEIPFCD